jgi:hypothetical protein
VKTLWQTLVQRSYLPYVLLPLAGIADLATSLTGSKAAGLTEGNPHFTPFLTEVILILYIFVIRKTTFFPQRTRQICEAALVIYSFSPATWNIFLILTSTHV